MPTIQVTGQLVDPTTGAEGSAEIRITSIINYGNTTKKSIVPVFTDANGNYDFPLVEGKHMFHVKYSGEYVFTNIGTAIVGDSTPDPIDLIQLINLSDENPPSELVTELQQLREDTINDIVDTSAQVLENAGYQGEWISGTSTALKGETWQVNGRYYVALKNTSVDPISDDDNWREDVTTEYVTTAQGDILGGKLFKGSNGEHVQNGDVVPVGTTHLRVLAGGKPTIVAMSPIASGAVSFLTEIGATIGITSVNFSQFRKLNFFNTNAASSVDNMLELFNINPLYYAIGTQISTGSTVFEYVDTTGPITLDNFRAINDVSVFSFGAKGDGVTNDTQAAQKAANFGSKVIFPKGDYLLNQVSIPNTVKSIELHGARLIDADPLGGGGIFDVTSDDYLSIKGGEYYSSGTEGFLIGQGAGNRIGIKISNAVFTGSRYAIDIDSANGLEVSACSFTLCRSGAIVSNNSSNCLISGNLIEGDGTQAVMTSAIVMQSTSGGTSRDNKIVYNTIRDTGDSSIFTRCFADSKLLNIDVSHNTIIRAGKGAIRFTAPAGNDFATIEGCKAIGNTIRGYSWFVVGNALASFTDGSDVNSTINNIVFSGNIIDGLDDLGNGSPLATPTQALWVERVRGASVTGNVVKNAYGYGALIQLNQDSIFTGNTFINSQYFSTSYDKTQPACFIAFNDNIKFDAIVTGTTQADGMYVRSNTESQISGVVKDCDGHGVYIEWVGVPRNDNVKFNIVSSDNLNDDFYFDLGTGDPLLERCDWTQCSDSLGPLTYGNTARRNQYFTGYMAYNVIYNNTETDTLDIKPSGGQVWNSISYV